MPTEPAESGPAGHPAAHPPVHPAAHSPVHSAVPHPAAPPAAHDREGVHPSARRARGGPASARRGALLALVFLVALGGRPGAAEAAPQEPRDAPAPSLGSYTEIPRAAPIRSGLPEVPGGFTFCRLWFQSARSLPSGVGWSTDYPRGDFNLTMRLDELTTTWTSRWGNADPGIAVVRATDPDLFRCPFLFASDPGSASFSEEEVEALRRYLSKGGVLWVDDFWGELAWGFWAAELGRILPGAEIVELPPDHPLLSIVYQVEEIPQIPNIQSWRRSGGETSEFGAETENVTLRVVYGDGEGGRIRVLMTHNTDIADGWEREMDDDEYFLLFSPSAYALGINILMWILTH